MNSEASQPKGPEFVWCEKLIITFGNRDSVAFDNCIYCLFPSGVLEIRVRETKRLDKKTITQNVSYIYKYGDVMNMKIIETVSVTEVEDETDNVVQLKTEGK